MYRNVKVFNLSSREYTHLLRFCNELNRENTGLAYYIGDIVCDSKTGKEWTTLLRRHPAWGSVMVVNPKEQDIIIDGVKSLRDKLKESILFRDRNNTYSAGVR